MNKIVNMNASGSCDCIVKNKTVTVLMSSYNGAKYIADQIESIMGQSGINVKLIIRDDGSTDNTSGIIKDLQEKYPQKIACLFGENIGIHRSFDYLYRYADLTDYFAFADQDDVWDSDKLYLAIMAMEVENSSFYSSSSRLVTDRLDDLKRTAGDAKKYKHYMCTYSKILTAGAQGCTIVIKRDLIEMLRNYQPIHMQGHDIWITIVAYYTANSLYDSMPHMKYRQHDNSWTGNRKNIIIQKRREIGFFFKGSSRYHLLAEDILLGYQENITNEERRILELLCQARHSFLARIRLFFLKGFGKYGLGQNFVFKTFLLLGIC